MIDQAPCNGMEALAQRREDNSDVDGGRWVGESDKTH